jgi:hypothetical protein
MRCSVLREFKPATTPSNPAITLSSIGGCVVDLCVLRKPSLKVSYTPAFGTTYFDWARKLSLFDISIDSVPAPLGLCNYIMKCQQCGLLRIHVIHL